MTNERPIILKALVGSHNYNLATDDSDRDYKAFIIPTFDAIYHNRDYNKSELGVNGCDIEIKDIRRLPDLLIKANPSYLEILFSQDYTISAGGASAHHMLDYLSELRELRDKIVKINMWGYYNGVLGTIKQKANHLEKGTEGTKHLVEKHGYDTKQLMHIFRLYDLITRFADNDFNNYADCLFYKDDSNGNRITRLNMLFIKDGGFYLSVRGIYNRIDGIISDVEKLKPKFINQPFNHELADHIKLMTFNLIKSYIFDNGENN